jgi:hypothetical protein
MTRFLLRLAAAALIANAAWRLGSAYVGYYRFREAVTEAMRFSFTKSDEEVRTRVLEIADQHEIPLAEDALSIRRENAHTYLDGTYSQPVELVPGYASPWSFDWHVDAVVITPPTLDPARTPGP